MMIYWALLFSLLFAAELPPDFREPTSEDVEEYVRLSDQYVLAEASLGDFIVQASGEFSESDADGLALGQFSYKYGRFSNRKGDMLERFLYFHQPLLAQIKGQDQFFGHDIDLLKDADGHWMWTSLGPEKVKEDEYKKLFDGTFFVHPMMGPFASASRLGKVGFGAKIFNEKSLIGVRRDNKSGRRIFLLAFKGVVPVEREIEFEKSLPVAKRDYWRNPRRDLISSTNVKWVKLNKLHVPVEFVFDDSQSGMKNSVKVELKWSMGDKFDQDFFTKESLGQGAFDNN
jgi:hypothetical protein